MKRDEEIAPPGQSPGGTGSSASGRIGRRRVGRPDAAEQSVRPPRFAQLVLRTSLPRGFVREAIVGDFWEDYRLRYLSDSPARARLWYWRELLAVGGRSLARRLNFSDRLRRILSSPQGSPSRAAGGMSPLPPRGRFAFFSGLWNVVAHDLPYAARNLARAPGFTAVAVLSLALGMVPLTGIGGFLNAVYFRPLPEVGDQDELVAIFRGVSGPVSWPDIQDVREQVDALEDAAAFSLAGQVNMTEGDTTVEIMAGEVSANYFEVLRVRMALGRGFTEEEGDPQAEPVAILGHTMWQRRFGGDPEVLGAIIRIDGIDRTVIGVAPEGLLSPEQPIEYAVYFPLTERRATTRGWRGLAAFGRLRDGATLDEVRGQLDVLAGRLREAYPENWAPDGREDNFAAYEITALRVKPNLRSQILAVTSLVVLLGLLVLATACSNLANLLLARGSKRGTEIAIRLAMGARRSTLVTMLLCESLLLGGMGGGLGLLVTHWFTRAMAAGRIGPGFGLDLTVDIRVLAFTAAASIATGILFGLIPALQAASPDLTSALKGEQTIFRRGRRVSFRNLLVVTQVAASLILLVSAGVVLRGLQLARSEPLGFEPEGVVAVEIDLNQGTYSEEQGHRFFEDLLTRVRAMSQVEAADLTVSVPFGSARWMGELVPEGVERTPESEILADTSFVTPGYFQLLGMPIVQGRTFDASDVTGAPRVAVVNQALAETLWPEEPPVGKRFSEGSRSLEVVGVVRDASYTTPRGDQVRHYWLPFSQSYQPAMFLMVRARGDARVVIPTLRQVVAELDPDLPVLEPRLLTQIIYDASMDVRLMTMLLAGAGLVALFLSVLGLYGVISFLVSQRTHEVGVRIALGADRAKVVRLILLHGLRLTGVGVGIGLVVAFGLAHVLAAMVAGVEPTDPVASLAGTLVLGTAATLATLVPALRASRVDPMVALRHE